jgi:hypothetical protein
MRIVLNFGLRNRGVGYIKEKKLESMISEETLNLVRGGVFF